MKRLLFALLFLSGCAVPSKTEGWCLPKHAIRRRFTALTLAFAAIFSNAAFADKPDVLEVLTVQGEINDFTAEQMTKDVEKINESPRSRAVLLILDTPGGGAIASAVMYEELSKLKVPVVVWCQNLCASGGVFLAMAPTVKYIGVRTETIGGSVGVRSQIVRYNRLLDFLKVDFETYTSGALKDAGNPTRAASDPEKQYLQGIVNALALKFYAVVEKGRPKISPSAWAEIKSARIFIGDEIVKIGLADAVMSRAEVIAKAKELSGSKTIFTREELKKMSSAADGHGGSEYAAPPLKPRSEWGDVPFLIELLKEVRAGQSAKFDYRMPYTF